MCALAVATGIPISEWEQRPAADIETVVAILNERNQ